MPDGHLCHLASFIKFKTYKELAAHCKRIESGRDRCRVFAVGGMNLSKEECKLACQAAIKAANTEPDQYQRAVSFVWPIRVCAHIGMISEANKLAGMAFKSAKSITPTNSRAYALEKICEQCWELDPKYRRSILTALFAMIENLPGWRIGRACVHLADEFDRIGDSAFVDELLKNCKNEWLIGRIERDRAKRRAQ
jgi:hypothetical protein